MSELTELLQKIDLEITSMHRHREYAITSRHAFIQARMNDLSDSYTQLTPLIGANQAIRVVNRAMERMADVMAEIETPPGPVVPPSLPQVMEAFDLDACWLAREAHVSTMTVWRARRGLPIAPAHAAALVQAVRQVTGVDLSGGLTTAE